MLLQNMSIKQSLFYMYILDIDQMTKRLMKHIIFSSSFITYGGKTKEITTGL